MTSVLDIRIYRIVPGEREEFLRLMTDQAVPMLGRYGIEVVTFGPSLHDDVHAFLARFFRSLAEREEQLGRFYGSDEWLNTYDERVSALIESYHIAVIAASREGASALATAGPAVSDETR